ncbi:MAG TPA: hypothetical protein VNX21_03160, partial [Candidatus Thermoplasmatota archaeon]|nr:hypothetical protein [Candidatus Thermoplasmatota archaeon]
LGRTQTAQGWTEVTHDLAAWGGQDVRILFRFTSAQQPSAGTPFLQGWSVDDVRITGPVAPVLEAVLAGFPLVGVGPADVHLSWGSAGNVPALEYELTVGGETLRKNASGTLVHRFDLGRHVVTLRVLGAGGLTAEATLVVDRIPVNVLQARVAGGDWVDVLTTDASADAPFDATLSLAGVPAGEQPVEVRHATADGRVTRAVATVLVP